MARTFDNWASDTPEHFQFSVKLWRGITHDKGLACHDDDLKKFLTATSPLQKKKGCLLIQLPPSCKASEQPSLSALLERIQDFESATRHPWRLAVEFRDRSWYTDETRRLLSASNAALVLHDMPGSGIGEPNPAQNLIYLRFHGPNGDYKDGYSNQTLHTQAVRIRHWLSQQKQVYVYFNNTIGDAVPNLKTLNQLLA